MPFDRTTIIRGPAIVQYAGGDIVYTAGDVTVVPKMTTFKIPTAFYGDSTDERIEQIEYEISFTPSGQLLENYMDKVYADLAVMEVGQSVLGSTDRALVVWAKNGEKHTFPNAFSSKPADIVFSATKPLFGTQTFTAMYKKNTAWSAADSIHKIETASFTDTSFVASSIPTGLYTVAWGADSPFSALVGAGDGVFSLNPTWEPVATNDDGVIDYRLKDLTGSFKFQPLGCTLAQLKTASVGALSTNLRGSSLAGTGKALTITGSNGFPQISTDKAMPIDPQFGFGVSTNRVGEVEFRFVRVAPGYLFSIASS